MNAQHLGEEHSGKEDSPTERTHAEQTGAIERAPYDRVAAFYDVLALAYTGRGIQRAKLEHLDLIEPGMRVLYAGAGTGAECLEATSRGADVTIAELSSRMLDSCRARFQRAQREGTFLCQDALTVQGHFDLVVAPFFLNVFSEQDLPAALSSLAHKVHPGGRLVTADFRRPTDSPFSLLQRAYYLPPLALFGVTTATPWHRLYDYVKVAERHCPSLKFHESRLTKSLGLNLLETLIFIKNAN